MSGLSLGGNQTGRLVPQMMMMGTIPPQNPYQMMMYSSVLKQRMHYLIRGTDYTEPTPDCGRNLEKENSSTDVSDGKEKTRPQMSNQLHESSLHSRDNRGETSISTHQSHQKNKKKIKNEKKRVKTIGTSESPMIIDDDGQAEEKEIPKKRKGFSYYPLLTYKRDLDKTFYYKYFRPYSHDYRRLRMEEDCQCPQTEPHDTKCEWYDPNIIYILEAPDDISASEEAAQQKIYDLYMSSMNSSHQ